MQEVYVYNASIVVWMKGCKALCEMLVHNVSFVKQEGSKQLTRAAESNALELCSTR
jgi:hypothetical protein